MSKFLFYDDKIINILLKEERPSGGAAVQAYGWIKGLLEEGQDVYLLTNTESKAVLKEECRQLQIVSLYDQHKGLRWIRWLYYRIPFLFRTIKQMKPDYLYQGIPGWPSFHVGLICRLLNVKYILRISNDYLLDKRFFNSNSRTHKQFQKMGMLLSHCILCQNDYQEALIRKAFPGKKVIKLLNPFYYKKISNTNNHQKQYIAWLGLYQYQKNIPLLYEICSKMKNEQFFVAGKEGTNCEPETLKYLKRLQALPNVRFTGFLQREQILPFLSKAKFLLNTSHYEGFSNTFLEAMAVGTPILTSTKVNPDSIISNKQLGLVYDSADDLINLYSTITPDLYIKMSNNVFMYVTGQHNYRSQAKKLLEFLAKN